MKDNQYTQKSITAINAAQDLASEYGNQELSQAHLLAALTDSADNLVYQLLGKMQLDAAAVRQYQAAVGTCLTQKLDALQRHTQRVSVGTVLDNAFLMERGPRIAIRYVPVGAAQVRIGSSLEEAGVNQVLYRVTLELAVDMTVLVPGGTRAVQCAQQIILEETLLTGRVPMFYGE